MKQEEKAKAYDEAIRKAKITLDCCDSASIVTKNTVYSIFPELAESENEKIKNRLINLIKMSSEVGGFALHKWEAGEMLAWLEKQGTPAKLSEEEQNRFAKVVLSSCATSFIYYLDAHKYEGKKCVSNGECEDIENAFYNAMWDRLHRYYCKYIEKQGEQKPSDEDMKTLLRTEYEKGRADTIAEMQGEWSEEDERMYRGLHNLIYSTSYCDSRKELSDWLESLKDRIQPKQEWSEKDEHRIKDTIYFLETAKKHYASTEELDACIAWLKSLRPQNNINDEELAQAKKNAYNDALDKIEYHSGEPTFDDGWSAAIWYLKKRNIMPQNHWKPSDEQMRALTFVCIKNADIDKSSIKALYDLKEQLKQL